MGALSHIFEANGLATVGIYPTGDIPERMRPPRSLVARFPLGRPLGRPRDPEFQRRVLSAAFSLLSAPAGPVTDTFPEVISDQADVALSCPVPPRYDPALPAAVDEARALRPAFERASTAGLSVTGPVTGPVSGIGVSVAEPDAVEAALAAFDRVAQGTPWKEAGLPRDLLGAARAVLGYYQQAALGLSDHVPAARQAESWYVQHTAAGATMRAARDQLKEQGAPTPLWFYLLPATQS
ncbi:MAG: hypothetical protein KGQ66_14615 [Acidobacteriota bacterium]|nr:hypothetical protein [Acidobacteriota bacterium]